MDLVTLIGTAAAILSTISFVPQAVKIIRSRDTSGISAGMYLITVAGFILWTTYGIMQKARPLIASNGICLVLSVFILFMKLLPQRETEKVAETLEPVVGTDKPSARAC